MSETIVSFEEQAFEDEFKELVHQTVEDTLNALLEDDTNNLVGGERYVRTADRELIDPVTTSEVSRRSRVR